jgi:glycosyltransferase involved in cell wall biosynthesis
VVETVVPGETGLLVPRDPEQFAACTQQLLSDPATRARYGRGGREHVLRHWTLERAQLALEEHLAAGARLQGAV